MTFLRVTLFSLVVLLAYTLFANILPQVQSNPPAEEEIEPGALDRAGQIAWGERLFEGKGACTLCHKDLGRAPDLLGIDLAEELRSRISDPGYRGAAKGLEEAEAFEAYLRESMLDPSAYVVPGFGKKGTQDRESPMPRADAPPVSLTPAEIDALIAFLQDRAGVEVTVALPAAEAAVTTAGPAAETTEEGPATTAEEVIDRYACAACHDLLGSGADVGPPLAGIGTRLDREALRRAILDPDAEIPPGYEPGLMPTDFGEQMRASELELLLDYLAGLEAGEAKP